MYKRHKDEGTIYSINKVANKEPDNNHSSIGESGNSDVDIHINIEVDTRPIGYAMLCSLLATKQISNDDFDHAVLKWEQLSNRNNDGKDAPIKRDRTSNVPGLRLFGTPRS